MAGYRVYSFDWAQFVDLTTNPTSEIPARITELLEQPNIRKNLNLPAKFPKLTAKVTETIRQLFLDPDWYSEENSEQNQFRDDLLMKLLINKKFESVGLNATPAWKKFHECCYFDLAYLLSGQFGLDLDRFDEDSEVYMQKNPDAKPEKAFWWFGNRPYRFTGWVASDEQQMDFEANFNHPVYSIQSPVEVTQLLDELAYVNLEPTWKKNKAIQALYEDYLHCLKNVQMEKGGMFVEVDY